MFKTRSLVSRIVLILALATLVGAAACSEPVRIQYTPVATRTPAPDETAIPGTAEPGSAEGIPGSGPVFGGGAPVALPEGPLTVVYTKMGDLWVWTEGAEPRQLTTGERAIDVQLSDDSQIAAFVNQVGDRQFDLRAVYLDGSGVKILADNVDLNQINTQVDFVMPNRFEWIPNTHELAYNTRAVADTPGIGLNGDLQLVDVDTLVKNQVFNPGSVGEFYYSPGGDLIAFASAEAISVANADGSGLTQVLTYTVEGTTPEFPYYPVPVWDQDANQLGVALPTADPMASSMQEVSLWRIPLDGTEPVEEGSIETILAPNWLYLSPDLEHVLSVTPSTTPGSNHREVHVSRLDGTESQVAGGADFLMAYGWIDSNSILFGGGETPDVYARPIGGEASVLVKGFGGLFDARPVGENRVLLFQGDGSNWTLSLYANGATFPIDSGDGFSPAVDADW